MVEFRTSLTSYQKFIGRTAIPAFLILLITLQPANHVVEASCTPTASITNIIFDSTNRTDGVRVESPPGFNPQSGMTTRNQCLYWNVAYKNTNAIYSELVTGESAVIRVEMKIDLAVRWETNNVPVCEDYVKMQFSQLNGSPNDTRFCDAPYWHTSIVGLAANGINMTYYSDSTSQGENGFRINFIPAVIPSAGSQAWAIEQEFTGCTPIALTSTEYDFIWSSQGYPASTPTDEECWAFYIDDAYNNDTDHYIQIQLLSLNGGKDAFLSAFDARNRSFESQLIAVRAGGPDSKYDETGKNYTACGETVWMSYKLEEYTSGLTVHGVMGVARLVPKATNECGLYKYNLPLILGLTLGILGFCILVLSVVAVVMAVAHKKQAKKRRMVGPTGAQTQLAYDNYPRQNNQFSPNLDINGPPAQGYEGGVAFQQLGAAQYAGIYGSTQDQPVYGQPTLPPPAYGQVVNYNTDSSIPSPPPYAPPVDMQRRYTPDEF